MKKKILQPTLLFLLLILSSFTNIQKKFELHNVIGKLNKEQIEEIKKISVKDEKGFKFVKKQKSKSSFTTFVTTTSHQKISKSDEKKIQDIIDKYK